MSDVDIALRDGGLVDTETVGPEVDFFARRAEVLAGVRCGGCYLERAAVYRDGCWRGG